jgi:hypothetical protein
MDDYYNDNDDSSTETFLILLLLVHNIDAIQAVIMGTYSHSSSSLAPQSCVDPGVLQKLLTV